MKTKKKSKGGSLFLELVSIMMGIPGCAFLVAWWVS